MMSLRARPAVFLLHSFFAILIAQTSAAQDYVPDSGTWAIRPTDELGFDGGKLRQAIEFAQANETKDVRDLGLRHHMSFGREPHGEAIGPFKTRGPVTGIIVRHGYIAAEFGEPSRVDMTFSVTKSFLSTTVGLAWADGIIADVDDRVAPYMAPVLLPPGDGERTLHADDYSHEPVLLFEDEHNRKITWNHLLRQTSAWRGTLWGKPDWADRPTGDPGSWYDMARAEPGSEYEYNDVRVNLLALAATQVWRQSLPLVLRKRIMDPIGASPTWRWHGYTNSWITLDGAKVQAVSGGGHWGGGMFINAYDQARFGLLTLRRGNWGGKQLLPDEWFTMATTPTLPKKLNTYGFMNYFLNLPNPDGTKRYPSVPDSALAHLGSGPNIVYVDPVNDLVVVVRWIDREIADEFLGKVIAAIEHD
jgi:CubicO group peptidase (beta-lactamase class C family)